MQVCKQAYVSIRKSIHAYSDIFIAFLDVSAHKVLGCSIMDWQMIVPCIPTPHTVLAHVVHRAVAAAKSAVPHAVHHAAHRLRHAIHAHPVVAAGCHVTPAALALITAGLLAPAQLPPKHFPSSGLLAPPSSVTASPWDDGALLRPANAPTDPGSAVITFFPGVISPRVSAGEILAPYITTSGGPSATQHLGAGPDDPGSGQAANKSPIQRVPEPSSLAVLLVAACGLGFIRRSQTYSGFRGVRLFPLSAKAI